MNKLDKACPSCKGTNVNLVKQGSYPVVIYLGIFSLAKTDFYVCLDCGFGQFWVDSENLRKVRDAKLKSEF